MASAMRPAPTKPTRLQPNSSAAAAITPLRRAPPTPPPHSAAPMGCEGLTCARPLAAETSRSALARGFRAGGGASRGAGRDAAQSLRYTGRLLYLGAPLVCEFRK